MDGVTCVHVTRRAKETDSTPHFFECEFVSAELDHTPHVFACVLECVLIMCIGNVYCNV